MKNAHGAELGHFQPGSFCKSRATEKKRFDMVGSREAWLVGKKKGHNQQTPTLRCLELLYMDDVRYTNVYAVMISPITPLKFSL